MTTRDATTTATTTTTARASSSATDDATETTTTTTTSAAPSFIETLARRRREHDALACEFALGERAPVTVGAPEDAEQQIEGYLQRCIFDDTISLDAMRNNPLTGPYLDTCLQDGQWRFEQQVMLIFL